MNNQQQQGEPNLPRSKNELAQALVDLPILSSCSSHNLARLVPVLRDRLVEEGAVVFNADDAADFMYYLCDGEVVINSGDGEANKLAEGFVGEEAAFGAVSYSSSVVATRAARLLTFPKALLEDILGEEADVRSSLYESYINRSCIRKHPFSITRDTRVDRTESDISLKFVIGWVCALLVPALTYYTLQDSDLSWPAINFLTLFSSAIVMWIFVLLPEHIPALLIITGGIILGLVPSEVLLSGYSSSSFFMALSIFGVGSVLVQSGLIYRLVLLLLRVMPSGGVWYNLLLYIVGFLLTPVVPMVNARVNLASSVLRDLVSSLSYKPGGHASTRLSITGFSSVTLLSACFITSQPINFAVFGFFPEQIKTQFTWVYWTYAAGVVILALLLIDFIVASLFFRHSETPRLQKERLEAQIGVIGPMTKKEWVAGLSILFLFIGILTSYMHKIEPPWIGLGVLFVLLALGSLKKSELQNNIDWEFLFMLGSFVGLAKTIFFLGIDQWFASHMGWINQFLSGNFYLFILLLAGCIHLVRLILPQNTTAVIMCSILIPLSMQNGINPWLTTFCVLIFVDGWFFPYQNVNYMQYQSDTLSKGMYNKKLFFKFNGLTNLTRLLAVLISVPFWQYLGLL